MGNTFSGLGEVKGAQCEPHPRDFSRKFTRFTGRFLPSLNTSFRKKVTGCENIEKLYCSSSHGLQSSSSTLGFSNIFELSLLNKMLCSVTVDNIVKPQLNDQIFSSIMLNKHV